MFFFINMKRYLLTITLLSKSLMEVFILRNEICRIELNSNGTDLVNFSTIILLQHNNFTQLLIRLWPKVIRIWLGQFFV